ncbi:uncharacterized protein LOC110980503 [Acanthaster planci]|uniref:Uncharacterized protein LOC110980503 n=1 Tax=Acanthaster planci TaxID=133434 RepID=A0A8B7YI75_ACAPL|nr:uncharacterized protein LOC110980503 [Acanthaster planci]
MAMEKQAVIKETHHRSVTAIGYHPMRREILAGFEDGVIKTWEAEGSKLVLTTYEHQGWVTDFLYWHDGKVMFSSSNDGMIVAWASGGGVYDRIKIGSPIYCMALNQRRHQLVCGLNGYIRVYGLDEKREKSSIVQVDSPYISKEHTDIVKCIVCLESRVYSAGFDSKLIIYDSSSYPGNKGLTPVFCNPKAHDAGISCLVLIKDTENNTWLVTGSFDKVVKIWSQDGKLTHRLDGFLSTITDLCYVPKNKTLWIASGLPTATLYDPKSGENVTDFIGTFQEEEDNQKYHLHILKYIPEMGEHTIFLLNGSFSKSNSHLCTKMSDPSFSLDEVRQHPLTKRGSPLLSSAFIWFIVTRPCGAFIQCFVYRAQVSHRYRHVYVLTHPGNFSRNTELMNRATRLQVILSVPGRLDKRGIHTASPPHNNPIIHSQLKTNINGSGHQLCLHSHVSPVDQIRNFVFVHTYTYASMYRFFNIFISIAASTSRRHLMMWKYNPSGCITALKCKHAVECLTYTHKVPILIFDGGSDGQANKWERLQSNHFMYSKETFLLAEAKNKLTQVMNLKKDPHQQVQVSSVVRVVKPQLGSHYIFNKPEAQPAEHQKHYHPALLKATFAEDLDLLLLGSEDGNIYVWGFDDAAVNALRDMKPVGMPELVKKYAVLLREDSELLGENGLYQTGLMDSQAQDSVTNRVAGFICKNVLIGHSSCVTCLTLIGRDSGFGTTYMLSSGWDRRICIWDLETGTLHDTFRNTSRDSYEVQELACDGIVIDMDYSCQRKEFAYASSDKMVYIRSFDPDGSKMRLSNTLQGHEGEITQVKWSRARSNWVTASEDGTIRIWSGDGMSCIQVLATHGAITSLCIDAYNSCIIAGVQNTIKVYDPDNYKLVQTNVGHTDSIRSILHLPERNQYVSGSWDGSLRVWNAFKPIARKKRLKIEEKRESIAGFSANNPNYLIEDDDLA